MDDPLIEALREHFGFDSFRTGQREVIERLLAGDSAAALFPTGSGKTLCYQLPAMLLPGLTLVVSPLIALMKDQIDVLHRRGIVARRLDSTLSLDEYREVMGLVRSGQLRLLYVAPERFNNERFRGSMIEANISLFAVDEAHCISEWGHNFRPDYLKLAEFARQCGAERTLALTATATEAVERDISQGFEIAPEAVIRTGFYRSNLTLLTTPVEADRRDDKLHELLREREPGATIVYVTLQKTASDVARRLANEGFAAEAYHAGMEDQARAKVQDQFLSQGGIVVATIAFGMGIDKADIRYIYHYNLPKSLENYSQEIGRAGRDGRPSICETLVCPADLNELENFAYGDTPTSRAVSQFLADVFSQGREFDVSHQQLAGKHDVRPLVVRTLLTYLELGGYLEGGTPYYSGYRFKPLLSSAEILDRFEGERRDFLRDLFRQAKPARVWFHIDVDDCAAKLSVSRDKVVRALDYLGDQQLLEVSAQGTRHRYTVLRQADVPQLAEEVFQKVRQRESRETGRLHQVLELAQRDGCQVAALSAYFDEPMEKPCGHCTWCLNGQEAVTLPPRPRPEVRVSALSQAVALRAEHPEVLAEDEALARLLCGIRSPWLTRAKLTRGPLFGSLADVPFPDVLEAVRSSISAAG